MERKEIGYYDVPYGLASAALTYGHNSISTTAAFYHGIRVVATTGDCMATVYDNASTTSGNTIDLVFVDSSATLVASSDLNNPIYAKNGIQINVSEGGAKGVVFYAPRG